MSLRFAMLSLAVSLILSCLCYIALGQGRIGYLPESRLSLGAGFSLENPEATKLSAIMDVPPLPMAGIAGATDVESHLVTNSRELDEALGIDASVSYTMPLARAYAKMQVNRNQMMRSDNISLIIRARSTFGTSKLDHPRLTKESIGVLKALGPNEFEKRYGNCVVTEVDRAASVVVQVTITDLAREDATAVKTRMGGGGAIGPGFLEGDAGFSSVVSEAISERNVNVKVFAVGGNGFSDLGKQGWVVAVTSADNARTLLQKISQVIDRYMETFGRSNAAVVGYHYIPIVDLVPPEVPERPNNPPKDIPDERTRHLEKLRDLYVEVEQTRRDLADIWAGIYPESDRIGAERRPELTKQIRLYEAYLSQILAEHKRAVNEKEFDPAKHAVPPPPREIRSWFDMQFAETRPKLIPSLLPTVREFDLAFPATLGRPETNAPLFIINRNGPGEEGEEMQGAQRGEYTDRAGIHLDVKRHEGGLTLSNVSRPMHCAIAWEIPARGRWKVILSSRWTPRPGEHNGAEVIAYKQSSPKELAKIVPSEGLQTRQFSSMFNRGQRLYVDVTNKDDERRMVYLEMKVTYDPPSYSPSLVDLYKPQ